MSHFGRSGPPDITDTYSLLILNISFRTTADDLFPLFDKYGKVVDVFIPRDRRTGESRGFAFVRYKYADEAQKAVDKLDESWMGERLGFSSRSTVPMLRECTETNIETAITGGEVAVEAEDDMIVTGTETGKGVIVTGVGAIAQVLTVAKTKGHPSMMTRTEVGVDHTEVHPVARGKLNMRGVPLLIRDLLHSKVLMYEMVKEFLSSTEICPVNVLPIPLAHLHEVHRWSGKVTKDECARS
ncbi:uncharacterized protein LOC115674959 isoform X3 [Syzygium oleosum]|uniref:uncharacterized protein LOC115674959 isoform X3 n=1 Tax=Syzygium oleosum TaxID=219896 RepID=UPI0024B8A0EF|nr:uncharacterized protein LOC115674959 isoform X3 [Syzygium oleosum]